MMQSLIFDKGWFIANRFFGCNCKQSYHFQQNLILSDIIFKAVDGIVYSFKGIMVANLFIIIFLACIKAIILPIVITALFS